VSRRTFPRARQAKSRRHRQSGGQMSPEALWELKRKPEWTPADIGDAIVGAVVVIGGIVCAVFGL
jgi:hypothetical protein